MKRWLLALVLGLGLGRSSSVHAYSDPGTFHAPVLEGGGGGRFFSGSPADGYGCDTCHIGGAQPKLQVSGVPSRYVPGATYELTLSWQAKDPDVAGLLELTDVRGQGAGTLALAADADVHDEEFCEPRAQGIRAAQLFAADRGRTIAAIADCGATQLRVQWTAPPQSMGAVWLAGSVVASDHKGDITGDGVTSFSQPVPVFGGTVPESSLRGGCSVPGAPGPPARPAYAWLTLGLALAGLCARSRRRPRAHAAR